MVEFEMKIVREFQIFFDVPFAKIDTTTTTLNHGNAISNTEVQQFSDTGDSKYRGHRRSP